MRDADGARPRTFIHWLRALPVRLVLAAAPLHEDCSWFHACKTNDLILKMRWAGYTYETVAVGGHQRARTAPSR